MIITTEMKDGRKAIQSSHRVSEQEIRERIAQYGNMPIPMVEAVFMSIAEISQQLLSEGALIELPHMGSLCLVLKDKKYTPRVKFNKQYKISLRAKIK